MFGPFAECLVISSDLSSWVRRARAGPRVAGVEPKAAPRDILSPTPATVLSFEFDISLSWGPGSPLGLLTPTAYHPVFRH
ncbi:hypothetical protein ACCO45_008654 [Purpureocillium lilacinum]|uniref:Uncharacterized protein n=1 Tax=Purpureocillium lilacinum TaxID=33203 RepID=A0ACC4DRJ9_PURLI